MISTYSYALVETSFIDLVKRFHILGLRPPFTPHLINDVSTNQFKYFDISEQNGHF